MRVQTIRTSVPFGLLVLLVIGSGVYYLAGDHEGFLREVKGSSSWFCGPCTDLGSAQCGSDAPSDNCMYDQEKLGCVGSCDDYCPRGSKHEWCVGLIGGCTITYVSCNSLYARECKPYFYGPPTCSCSRNIGAACGSRSNC